MVKLQVSLIILMLTEAFPELELPVSSIAGARGSAMSIQDVMKAVGTEL